MGSCYAYITQMLQYCYKKQRNNYVMRLKRFCNIMIVSLQTGNSLYYMKKEKVEKIIWIVNWIRIVILALFLTLIFAGLSLHS
jgi:hypothetical protein